MPLLSLWDQGVSGMYVCIFSFLYLLQIIVSCAKVSKKNNATSLAKSNIIKQPKLKPANIDAENTIISASRRGRGSRLDNKLPAKKLQLCQLIEHNIIEAG
jgi:hypothetical protein